MNTESAEPRVPHGYELSPDRHALLRSRPPPAALAWVARVYGPRATVVDVRARRGGSSSAIHAVAVVDAGGTRHRAVLRRYVLPGLLVEEPGMPAREALVLDLLERAGVAAPRLIAADLAGTEAGSPSLLMSLVPGRLDWDPRDMEPYLRRLAEPLPAIHAVAVPDGIAIQPYQPYEIGRGVGPPPWARHRRAWERAAELYEAPPPSPDTLFIHRDYHPGNVLWRRGRVTGVVDWQSTSIGAPEVDVGHCRMNLWGHFSYEVADRFLELWKSIEGRDEYHPYFDIAAILNPPSSYGPPDERVDDWIASTMARVM